MKILLTAVNAKYIHSNPAVYSLYAYAGAELQSHIEIAEFTINQQMEEILSDIYQRQPDVIAVSCYIWNIEMVTKLLPELHKVLPNMEIWVGGPEVSYDAVCFLDRNPSVKGVMAGEGEVTFRELCHYYTDEKDTIHLGDISGIVYREQDADFMTTNPRKLTDMSEIPFFYQNMEVFTHRIVYYESSRGCPFSCSYCLSSIDKSVRFRDIELVKSELQFFLDHNVPQVKFVDRTFNCSHAHAMSIWNYIKEHDTGVINFHFEIAADILNEEELSLLNTFRPGLAQLEIGVQSTNKKTIHEIRRTMDFEKLKKIVERIKSANNIHIHLDLIAGLPYEDITSFRQSFDDVYSLEPEQLQLGFLKVLKGSFIHEQIEEYGIHYMDIPPYEVLFTRWLSFADVLELKAVEEMVETYYNSNQFRNALKLLKACYSSAYDMYFELACFYKKSGYAVASPSRIRRYEILLEFADGLGVSHDVMCEELTMDLYLRENMKSRPAFCKEQVSYRELFHEKPPRSVHVERYHGEYVQFDYESRNPLTGDADVKIIRKETL